MVKGRDTRRWRTIKRELRERAEAESLPCWICTEPIDYTITDIFNDEVFEADHVLARKTHPHLAEDPANAAPSHRRCNNVKGQAQRCAADEAPEGDAMAYMCCGDDRGCPYVQGTPAA